MQNLCRGVARGDSGRKENDVAEIILQKKQFICYDRHIALFIYINALFGRYCIPGGKKFFKVWVARVLYG